MDYLPQNPAILVSSINMLLRDEEFDSLESLCYNFNTEPEFLEWVASIKSDEYYIRMMQAWFFATALAKQWDSTLPYIEQHRLEKDTHNKTIQKAIESYRITDEQKRLLRAGDVVM